MSPLHLATLAVVRARKEWDAAMLLVPGHAELGSPEWQAADAAYERFADAVDALVPAFEAAHGVTDERDAEPVATGEG
jgi:hypothetical protein